MRDLDIGRAERESRDRTFKIAGTEFTLRAGVKAKAIERWNKFIAGEYVVKDERGLPVRDPEPALNAARRLLQGAASDGNGKVLVDATIAATLREALSASVPVSTIGETEALEIYEETILAYLEPGQEEKWARVTSDDATHPLTLEDYLEIIKTAVEVTAERPTGQPSASSAKPDGSGTNSTDGSSLQEVPVSAV